jgi:hypothetical protein
MAFRYDGDYYLQRKNTQRRYQKQLGKIMQVLQGRVEKPYGKSFPNKFNPNELQSVLKVELEDGTTHSIYGAPDQLPHCNLRRGDPCQIVFEQRNGKTIRRLLDGNGNGGEYGGQQRQQSNNRQPQQSRTDNLPRQNTQPVASTFPSKPQEPADVTEQVKNQAKSLASTISYLDEALKEQGYADVPFGEIRNLAVSIFINLDRNIHGEFTVKPPVEPASVFQSEDEDFESDEDYGFYDEDYDDSEQTDLF